MNNRIIQVAGLTVLLLKNEAMANPCAQIFHDPGETESSIYLKNLLGHFPHFDVMISSIDQYKKGQIENCDANFYLASKEHASIPLDFLLDYKATQKQAAWIGFSIHQLGESDLKNIFGLRYRGMASLDSEHLDSQGRPTFYRLIHYKGETFEKYGELNPTTRQFSSSYPMAIVEQIEKTGTVLAEAEHNLTHEKLPYAIQKNNHFYLADIPFSYVHGKDRYLVFADLLFDILNSPPLYPDQHPALIRIEDINVTSSEAKLSQLVEALKAVQVPAQIALIPIFSDPFGVTGYDPTKTGVSLDQSPSFVETLQKLQNLGASIIWHGVTHQYGNHKNPTGVSANDFEFTLSAAGQPIPEDSVEYVLNLLNRGWTVLDRAGIHPSIWEVPHYSASALDYSLFARLFSWNYGKVLYSQSEIAGLPTSRSDSLLYESSGLQGDSERRKHFSQLKNTLSKNKNLDQFFPYEIYRDLYGQRVLPENLGYPHLNSPTKSERTLDMILEDAKRNRVIRDSWASFFIHLDYINKLDAQDPGQLNSGIKQVIQLVDDLKALGYQFINANEWARNHR